MRINSDYLRSLMAYRRISNLELAQASAVSVTNISQIRNGKSCRRTTAEAIASALDVPLDELSIEPINDNV